jgi:hypothetical protein
MMKENILADKSKRFALKIIKLCRYINDSHREYILSRQITTKWNKYWRKYKRGSICSDKGGFNC